MTALLIAVVERVTGDAVLAGDLLEESAMHPPHWLWGQVLGASLRCLREGLLESAASAGLLILLPVALVNELRRYLLTLVPFREAAEFRWESVAAVATLAALLAMARTSLVGRRGPLMAAAAAGVALLWSPMTGLEWLFVVLFAAGGSLAKRSQNP